ncbi:uncharacterized protein LOC129595253 [Paramacrobiotus metropolitanus]|uniref:uncharacterized protein LOC129595253 n=1 Tax=Paramacrobiotus metropolitanus TaxID=2943436 RepID=UPI0024461EE1|nr:uncharacterized protein LOC129595253 [Paramacrobiotus metropolitanus]
MSMLKLSFLLVGLVAIVCAAPSQPGDSDSQQIATDAFFGIGSIAPKESPAYAKCGAKFRKARITVKTYKKEIDSGSVLYNMKVDIAEPSSGSSTGRTYRNKTFKVFKARTSGQLFIRENPCDSL